MASGKQKTRKAVAKRFKVSGSGKLLRERAAHNHRLNPKSKRSKTLAGQTFALVKGDKKVIRQGLHS
jgi:large subunit ribosomal protein L35